MSKTIEFFKEIAKIPRETGNEKQISDYICEFAKKRNLEYIQDKYNNVVIKKYNGKNEPIILQAHLDMVCEKDDLDFDFEKDEIVLIEEDGYIKAKGTTLGADNGIGIAQILNILDSDLQVNIEAVFTVSEETTMVGAEYIDVSILKGKKLINLDGFEKNTIINESAGFVDIVIKTNYEYIDKTSSLYKITLKGLEGGHSGFDINKNRGNSIIELAKFLLNINDIRLAELNGGTKFNVIPSTAESIFESNILEENLRNDLNEYENKLKNEYPNIQLKICKITNEYEMLSNEKSKHFLKGILNIKNGVIYENSRKMPVTSSNLGIVNLKDNEIKIGFRSSRENEKKEVLEKIELYCMDNGYVFSKIGEQPSFKTKKESSLIKDLIKAFKETIHEKGPNVVPLHITVEAGFFKQKISDLEVAIISPEILGAHTTKERVSIESIHNCDKWLIKFLKSL